MAAPVAALVPKEGASPRVRNALARLQSFLEEILAGMPREDRRVFWRELANRAEYDEEEP